MTFPAFSTRRSFTNLTRPGLSLANRFREILEEHDAEEASAPKEAAEDAEASAMAAAEDAEMEAKRKRAMAELERLNKKSNVGLAGGGIQRELSFAPQTGFAVSSANVQYCRGIGGRRFYFLR